MIFRFRIIFLLIYLLTSNLIYSQERTNNYTYSTGVEFFNGFIIKHREVIGNLINGHPTGFRLVLNKQSYGAKDWERDYNYPTFTTTLSYYDLKNDEVLGKIVSLNFGMSFHLNNFIQSKNDLQLLFGYGLAYITNPYEPDNNNTNTLISNRLPWSVNLKLSYYRQISGRIKLGIAGQFSHFSNGSSSIPNYGVNIVNLNVGGYYNLYTDRPAYNYDKMSTNSYDKKSFINLDFRMGATELTPVGSGAKPYYALSIFWNKQISKKSIIDSGIEGFMNKGLEQSIKNNSTGNEELPDYKALGVMVGHELLLGKLAFVTQLGYYIYKPYYSEERIYFKVGLKYYITKNIFGSFMLKTHYAVAEVMEFGVGIRL